MSAMQHITQPAAWPYPDRGDSSLERRENVSPRSRAVQIAVLGMALLLPLLVVPGWQHPFSSPKLMVWTVVVLCGMVWCLSDISGALTHLPKSLQWALVIWVGAVCCSTLEGQFASLQALLAALTGTGWLVLLIATQPSARNFSWILVSSGTVVAGIAVLQSFGADPFSAFGWIPTSTGNARMRIFATLGNPDFVAAFLTGLLPLALSLASLTPRKRWLGFGLCAVQAVGIVATGSRSPILGLVAAALWMSWFRARRWTVTFSAISASVVLIAGAISPVRSISETLQGRLYIWKVSSPHLSERWVTGLGPGGFGASFAGWETQYWRGMPGDDERKFAGIEDHAHNDYLEIFAAYGALGILSFLGVLVFFLRTVAKHRGEIDPVLVGASAGVVALAADALVDFPLARPAEIFLFWSLIAISCARTIQLERASRNQI